MKKKIKIELPDGRVIERVPITKACGNFCQLFVTLNKEIYSIGDGDEYIRGVPDTWRLSYSYTEKKYIAYSEQDSKTFKETMIWKDFSQVK